jgi:CBS domain-containing protein
MKIVRNLLQEKGSNVWSVAPATPVYDALKLMAEKDIGALVVLEEDRLAGIFSERDYARKVILKGKASKDTPVKEIMTEQVVTVKPQQSLAECLALMSRKNIRHLPVMEEDQIMGILSIGDVVQAYISEQEDALQLLENRLMGTDLD